MKSCIQVVGASIISVIACGCAGIDTSPQNLRQETARSMGGNVSPDQVTVSDVDLDVSGGATWHAATPQGSFTCSSDGKHKVLCTRR
jgi:hypothetical protein